MAARSNKLKQHVTSIKHDDHGSHKCQEESSPPHPYIDFILFFRATHPVFVLFWRLEVLQQALVGRRENAVASQHHPSLHVRTHRYQRARHFSHAFLLLNLAKRTWPRGHSSLLPLRRLVPRKYGPDGRQLKSALAKRTGKELLIGA